jgi:CRP-like cAMP-binding protein
MDAVRYLETHALFVDVPPAELRAVLGRVRVRERSFSEGQVTGVQGDLISDLSVIYDGSLAATMESANGKSLMVETLGPGEVLAPAVLLAAEPRLPVTLTAVRSGGLVVVPLGAVLDLAEQYPAVYRTLLELASAKFEFLTTKMRLLHFASLRQKIAGFLLELADRQGSHSPAAEVRLPYTRERLAELFGVARPSLSRALGELADENVIRAVREHVVIRDIDALRAELEAV